MEPVNGSVVGLFVVATRVGAVKDEEREDAVVGEAGEADGVVALAAGLACVQSSHSLDLS